MINDKQLPRSIEVTFYIKPRAKRITTLRKVRVTLNNVIRVRDAISVILKCAELPTSYVDSLPDLVIKNNVDPNYRLFQYSDHEVQSNYQMVCYSDHDLNTYQTKSLVFRSFLS